MCGQYDVWSESRAQPCPWATGSLLNRHLDGNLNYLEKSEKYQDLAKLGYFLPEPVCVRVPLSPSQQQPAHPRASHSVSLLTPTLALASSVRLQTGSTGPGSSQGWRTKKSWTKLEMLLKMTLFLFTYIYHPFNHLIFICIISQYSPPAQSDGQSPHSKLGHLALRSKHCVFFNDIMIILMNNLWLSQSDPLIHHRW